MATSSNFSFIFQHADLEPTKLLPQMPSAPNVLPTARPRKNKPMNAYARKASTAPSRTHAQWLALVSKINK